MKSTLKDLLTIQENEYEISPFIDTTVKIILSIMIVAALLTLFAVVGTILRYTI